MSMGGSSTTRPSMRVLSLCAACVLIALVFLSYLRESSDVIKGNALAMRKGLSPMRRVGGCTHKKYGKTFEPRRNLRVNAFEIHDAVQSLAVHKDAIVDVAKASHHAVVAHTPNVMASIADAVTTQQPVVGDGPFGKFVKLIAGTILYMSNQLQAVGIKQSVGLSIVLFTVFVKLVTFPLNEQQIKSSETMAVIQPKIKEIQEKYKDDPVQSNEKLQAVYRENQVNPLAGLLPTFAQIPIFIALYRALQLLATQDQMNQPFLWLPNLEGPTFGQIGGNWLFQHQFGLHDTVAYASLPVLLIVSQIVSQRLLTTKEQYDAQPQWTKYLPVLFGYFALNVPSGLAVYWTANNFVTTVSNYILKAKYREDPDVIAMKERIAKIDAPKEKQMPYVKAKAKEEKVVLNVENSLQENSAPPSPAVPTVSSRGKDKPPKMKKSKKKAGKKKRTKARVSA